jgi:nitroimidazol reductase NimA-like FMN-containing flavoprotein (pyridoxamine 5'-phosphate oxidase superfamily)
MTVRELMESEMASIETSGTLREAHDLDEGHPVGAHRADPGLIMDPVMIEEATGFLRETPVAHLGLVSDGKPYVTPMAFVVDDGRILFRTRPGRKLEAIIENPAVCIEAFSFDESTGDWHSVIVNGRASQVTDPAVEERAVTLLLERYANQLGSPSGIGVLQPLASTSQVIEVVIDQVSSMT